MIDQALPPSVSQATGDIVEIAKDAIEGVRGWAGEVAEQARDKVSPTPKKKRSKLPLLLVAIGLGALVYFLLKRARERCRRVLGTGRVRRGRRGRDRRQERRARAAVDAPGLTPTRDRPNWRRRRESNPCTGLCRPLPEPLGYAAGTRQRTRRSPQGSVTIRRRHASPDIGGATLCDPTDGSADDDPTARCRCRGAAPALGGR